MNDDDLDLDLDPAPAGVDRKVLLLILAGMAGLAVSLAIIQARMKRPALTDDFPMDAGWQASLEHLAQGWEIRFAGIDNRLNDLAADRVHSQATLSQAPEPLAESNGSVERVPPVIETGPDNKPPPPAAVSLP